MNTQTFAIRVGAAEQRRQGVGERAGLFDAVAACAPGLHENGLVRLGHLAGSRPIDADTRHEILGKLAAYAMVRRLVKRSVQAERGRSEP